MNRPSPPGFPALPSHAAGAIAWALAAGLLTAAVPASVTLSDLVHTYDGTGKLPTAITSPAGLAVSWWFVDPTAPPPQPVVETVFRSTPATLGLSYPSLSFSAQQTHAFGDFIQLAGNARTIDSADVVMVTWAKAANYPALALADPTGWHHPITFSIYESDAAGRLQLRGEIERQIFVPWRPLKLPNGSNYPYNGYAFVARFDFPAGFTLPERAMYTVSYDTQNFGFSPLRTPGPYNELNVASGGTASIGVDLNNTASLWVKAPNTWTYPAVGLGAPMVLLRASRVPAAGSGTPPVNAGSWQATAKINDPNYTGDASATLVIQPATSTVTLANLVQLSDGKPKPVQVLTDPSGLALTVTYNGQPQAPTAPGLYQVSASITSPNYQGTTTGELWVARRFELWMTNQAPGLSGSETGETADPDGDSIANLLEYALALDPSAPDDQLPNRGRPRLNETGGVTAFHYRRNTGADDLIYQVESTDKLTDAASWRPVATEDSVIATGDGWREIRATIPVSEAARLGYFRLRVSRLSDL